MQENSKIPEYKKRQLLKYLFQKPAMNVHELRQEMVHKHSLCQGQYPDAFFYAGQIQLYRHGAGTASLWHQNLLYMFFHIDFYTVRQNSYCHISYLLKECRTYKAFHRSCIFGKYALLFWQPRHRAIFLFSIQMQNVAKRWMSHDRPDIKIAGFLQVLKQKMTMAEILVFEFHLPCTDKVFPCH